jgi:hypothetical protein
MFKILGGKATPSAAASTTAPAPAEPAKPPTTT